MFINKLVEEDMKDWYSVRMRSSIGAPHEKGGIHISGAERLVELSDVELATNEMIQRAMHHFICR